MRGQEFDDRDWNERYQRGGRSSGPNDDDFRYRSREREDERGYGRRQGQGGPGYYGGQGQLGGSHYGQMGQGQLGGQMGQLGGQMGEGQRSRDYERDWEDYGRVGGHGRSGWTSRPGYGGGFFEQERGRGMQGQQSRGQLESQFRGRGPKGYTRSDDRIQEEVCELLSEADIDVSEVTVRVSNGVITLEGTVDSRYDKREIEDIACEARGVKDCQNQLKVSTASESDEESAETGRSRGRSNISSSTGESSSRSTRESRSSGNAMS